MESPNKSYLHLSLALTLIVQQLILPMATCSQYANTNAAFIPSTPRTMASIYCRRHQKASSPLMAIDTTTSMLDMNSNMLVATTDSSSVEAMADVQDNLQIEQLDPATIVFVFIIGIIPFIWATWEFWRRIAVGASFGTGSDSVVIPSPFDDDMISIGEDGNPLSSRGRQTLDRGALTVAYILFAVAGGSVAIAIASVVMGPQAPPI